MEARKELILKILELAEELKISEDEIRDDMICNDMEKLVEDYEKKILIEWDTLSHVEKYLFNRTKEQAKIDHERIEKSFDKIETNFGTFLLKKL
jgi:hypothetical protein